MNVTCPNCATTYRVDPAKVPEAGVRARCAVCAAVFPVRRDQEPSAPAPTPQAQAAEPAGASAPRAAAPAPVAAPPARPAAPPRPGIPPAVPRPAGVGPAPTPAAPAAPAGSMPPPAGLAPVVAPSPPPSPSAPPPAPAAPPAATAAGEPKPVHRPVNPFLSQDPSQKARRLARALISDMVVYHPAKRQEGLRDGNLKELFDEEIKKSWEEYTDQVGTELAESTPYFREALNEILAEGRSIF